MRMKWDTDRIVSISAMLVGLGSLFIVLYQTTLMREQAKASVLPYLLIAYNTNNDGSYIALLNAGLGPALIDRVRVIHQGKAFDGDPYAYYASLADAKVPPNNVYRDRVLPGMLIPEGRARDRALVRLRRALAGPLGPRRSRAALSGASYHGNEQQRRARACI